MTLKEMKQKTFSLIEEYYPEQKGLAEDEDVLNKINGVVNQIQMDLMKYRKIDASKEIIINKEDKKIINISEVLNDCYQLKSFVFSENIEYETPNDDTLILPEDFEGKFTIYYFRYPKLVQISFNDEEESKKYDEEFNFDLDLILLEIMPYGIAADLLKMDMISSYGRYFYERYMEMKNNIDSRKSGGLIKIEGGIDV